MLRTPYYRFWLFYHGAGLPVPFEDAEPDTIIDFHQARLAKARRIKAQIEAERAGGSS